MVGWGGGGSLLCGEGGPVFASLQSYKPAREGGGDCRVSL